MKKVFAAAAIALFMMTSCSDDSSSSNNNNNTDTVLLKKTIEVSNGVTVTTNYTYNGNKLANSQGSDGSHTTYTYSGDLLTGVVSYDEEAGNISETYEYNSNNTLKSHTIKWTDDNPDYIEKSDYTYNSNGTVTMASYYGDEGEELELYDTYTITMNNGNITSVNGTDGNNTYTFDTKNSPFKNITGYNAFVLGEFEGGINNELTYSSTEFDESFTTIYTYNSSNYPLTSTETLTYDGGEDTLTTQYFYE